MPEHETCSIGDCRLLFLASIQPNNVNVLVSKVGFYVKAREHSDWVCGAAIMAHLSQGEEESRKGSCDHRIASEVIYTATSLLNARTPKPILDGALAKDSDALRLFGISRPGELHKAWHVRNGSEFTAPFSTGLHLQNSVGRRKELEYPEPSTALQRSTD